MGRAFRVKKLMSARYGVPAPSRARATVPPPAPAGQAKGFKWPWQKGQPAMTPTAPPVAQPPAAGGGWGNKLNNALMAIWGLQAMMELPETISSLGQWFGLSSPKEAGMLGGPPMMPPSGGVAGAGYGMPPMFGGPLISLPEQQARLFGGIGYGGGAPGIGYGGGAPGYGYGGESGGVWGY